MPAGVAEVETVGEVLTWLA
ncbi:cobalamin biosynthesis protein [Janibacter sp. HTCC2649]|nr:cobalamin biosynthesis protein [Janibacter sp. HTCC2649]